MMDGREPEISPEGLASPDARHRNLAEESAADLGRDAALDAARAAYDRMANRDDPLCRIAKDAEVHQPLSAIDPCRWLGDDIRGKRLLCLAAGGGRQSAIYATAGADVTVVDISPAMLERDRLSAAHRGHSVRLIEASMDRLTMFAEAEFDIVVHPVSTCYLPRVIPVFTEVARVIRPGGLYISQHKSPTSLQTSERPKHGGYVIERPYYTDGPIPPPDHRGVVARRIREEGAREHLHRWEQLIGGMCRCGFVIEDLVEPDHHDDDAEIGSFAHRANYVAPYVRIKARRRSGPTSSFIHGGPERTDGHAGGRDQGRLWLPPGTAGSTTRNEDSEPNTIR